MATAALPSTPHGSPGHTRARPQPRNGPHTPRQLTRSPGHVPATRHQQRSDVAPPGRRTTLPPRAGSPSRSPSSPQAVPSAPPTPKPRSPRRGGIPDWAEDVKATSPAPPSTAHPASADTHRVGGKEIYVIDGIERESWEVITQDATEEEDGPGPDHARLDYARQVAHYKNLLVRAQSASSASLHELHTQLHNLEKRYQALREEHARCGAKEADVGRLKRVETEASRSLSEGKGLRDLIRESRREERVDLLGIVAEACYPSDIDAQIRLLEKYKRSKWDIIGRLPDRLATKVLLHLELPDVGRLRLACKRYATICRLPEHWRRRCRDLEWRDWDGEAGLAHLADVAERMWRVSLSHWHRALTYREGLFRQLWNRERNWNTGQVSPEADTWNRAQDQAQRVLILAGHTNYVTSLKLRGDILISGSYDETIRVWPQPCHWAESAPTSLVLPAKAVSCLDYFPPEQVLVSGTHDVGRVQVWQRDIAGKWNILHSLAGHLHGIRAVAINETWLVSAGADKALVVWDWRTGEKVVRFGQQTNICVGIQLVVDHIVAMTVDGVIRTFSIRKRDMISQYKLSDLHGGEAQMRSKLRDVRGGVGGVGMINWFEGQGRDITCATRAMILRLEWEEMVEEYDDRPIAVGTIPSSPPIRTSSMANRPSMAPATPAKSTPLARQRTSTGMSRAPVRSPPPPNGAMSIAGAMMRSKSHGHASPTTGRMAKSVASTLTSTSPSSSISPRDTPSRRASLPPFSRPGPAIPENSSRSRTEGKICTIPVFSRPPTVKEVLDAADVERGAVDARRSRIVSSTRFAARSGADRQLYVTSPADTGPTAMVPVTGAWQALAVELGLQTPEKNPMSIVMDRDKFVYGCTDGTIVIVGFS